MGFIIRRSGGGPMDPTRRNRLLPPPEAMAKKGPAALGDPEVPEQPDQASPHPESTDGSKLVGLRIDSMTWEGTSEGIPRLAEALAQAGVRGSFFAAVGPDHGGRALLTWLRHPAWWAKALRIRSVAGTPLRTLLSGLALPSRPLGPALAQVVEPLLKGGHEVGALGWDYWLWTRSVAPRSLDYAAQDIEKALESLRGMLGSEARCAASPGFLCTDSSLRYQDNLAFRYTSDCRGSEPFLPVVLGKALRTPQVPVTLPTLTEWISEHNLDLKGYYSTIFNEIDQQRFPVLRVRADMEGRSCLDAFRSFVDEAGKRSIRLVPLGDLLGARRSTGLPLPRCTMSYGSLEGRLGIVSLQMLDV